MATEQPSPPRAAFDRLAHHCSLPTGAHHGSSPPASLPHASDCRCIAQQGQQHLIVSRNELKPDKHLSWSIWRRLLYFIGAQATIGSVRVASLICKVDRHALPKYDTCSQCVHRLPKLQAQLLAFKAAHRATMFDCDILATIARACFRLPKHLAIFRPNPLVFLSLRGSLPQ